MSLLRSRFTDVYTTSLLSLSLPWRAAGSRQAGSWSPSSWPHRPPESPRVLFNSAGAALPSPQRCSLPSARMVYIPVALKRRLALDPSASRTDRAMRKMSQREDPQRAAFLELGTDHGLILRLPAILSAPPTLQTSSRSPGPRPALRFRGGLLKPEMPHTTWLLGSLLVRSSIDPARHLC